MIPQMNGSLLTTAIECLSDCSTFIFSHPYLMAKPEYSSFILWDFSTEPDVLFLLILLLILRVITVSFPLP
jgi:hypothetical protein